MNGFAANMRPNVGAVVVLPLVHFSVPRCLLFDGRGLPDSIQHHHYFLVSCFTERLLPVVSISSCRLWNDAC